MIVEILSSRQDVKGYVSIVQKRADSERDALGFLPIGAYTEAAAQEKLFVAVVQDKDQKQYAGHIMFGGAFPNGRVYQVFVEPACRGQQVGETLIDAVVNRYERENFLCLKAHVANDLKSANSFWERMGFSVALVKPGGKTRGRKINIRVRYLEVPSLLSLLDDTKFQIGGDLGLVANLSQPAPLYVIDLNVLFDVAKGRPRSDQAGRVIAAGFKNTIRLAVSEEFIEELGRNSSGLKNDPILELALKLPKLAHPPETEMASYYILGKILFPSRYNSNQLSIQDKSDIRHIATVIHHRATGFITSENAILRARAEIQSKFAVDIVGLEEFTHFDEPEPSLDPNAIAVATKSERIEIRDLQSQDVNLVVSFLKRIQAHDEFAKEALHSASVDGEWRKLIVTTGGTIVAFSSWNRTLGPRRISELIVCADEEHAVCETTIDYLINRACSELSSSAPSLLNLRDLSGRALTRQVAIAQGFRPAVREIGRERTLQKICIGKIVTGGNWQSVREQINKLTGVFLPKTMPDIHNSNETIPILTGTKQEISISMEDLENLLSPVLFLFPSRYGAIVPIRRSFADELLGTSDQQSFLESQEASLLHERAYICTPRAASTLQPGTPLLFYESSSVGRGRSSVVAIGRSIASDIVLKSDVPASIDRRSVLDERSISQLTAGQYVLATKFDNVMRFKTPVPFKKLKSLGAVDGANLITTRRLTGNIFMDVVADGWSDAH